MEKNFFTTGTVSWEKFDGEKTLELLIAADELCLNELLEYVQDYFITKGNDWLLKNIDEYCHTIFQHDNFHKLQESCIKMVSNDPQRFGKRGKFMEWPDKLVTGILKRDDLHLEEIDVWILLLKWGVSQIELSFNIKEWALEDFSRLALKLKDCIQFIRFYHISGADFYNHVRPYKSLLPKDLYENLLRYHFKMDKPPISTTLVPPRGIALDSKLIGSRHAALIASWIDHQKNFDPLTCHLVPCHFNLLLRGSRDNFKCSTFHRLCDNQGPALIVLKVKGTGELLGGYNPIAILSRIKNYNCAIDDSPCIGPCFGISDLVMVESSRHANGKFIYDLPWSCIQRSYEKSITTTTNFTIEDYEVFKLIKKDLNNVES
ncbi:17145_t:CDS:2 [Funneliformis caledonium]|uniref:17145_t:CDS:1 n=1 Tax=Funneliformis caledonium TaxID=1117310 RepID=A0A9N8UY11_9GLOM|nr:17145_t:CDS:2 [Funneliformis caledonium]